MNVSSKADPENLQLRATPRQVVRFKRGFLIGATALASGAVLGVAMMALRSPAPRLGNPEELYDLGKKATPDGLAALPGDYSQMKLRPPVLGPPLPGDLGRPILAQQRALAGQELSAEEQRLAQQALHAREAGVFFRIENRLQPNAVAGKSPPLMAAALSQPDLSRLTLDPERDQNNQQRKLDFLNQRKARVSSEHTTASSPSANRARSSSGGALSFPTAPPSRSTIYRRRTRPATSVSKTRSIATPFRF